MRLGPYEVEGEIGRGAMGIVFRARGPDGRSVAVKLLLDQGDAARFARELELMKKLSCEEGFVPVLEAGTSPNGPWFAMPLFAGTLRARLRHGPLPVAETIELGRALAGALGRAHAKGVVHRDLKPENVLLAEKGAPCIADLGLAKIASAASSLSGTGMLAGTPGYAAPEQLDDARSAKATADVHALGAVLYECLTGAKPWGEGGLLSVVERMKSGELAPVRRLRPDAPAWLAAAIERALAFRPQDRFADGTAFFAALEPPRVSRRALGAALLVVLAGAAGLVFAASKAASKADSRDPLVASCRAALDRHDREKALSLAKGIVERAPKDPAALVLLARAHHEQHELREAYSVLSNAILLDPKNAEAIAWRAIVGNELGELGDVKQEEPARKDAARATELAPGLALAWVACGATAPTSKESIEFLDKAVALDPTFARAFSERARFEHVEGENARARKDAERALALDPKHVHARIALAAIDFGEGHFDSAIATATRIIEEDPRDPGGWALRGMAEVALEDGPSAKHNLDRAFELGDRSAPVLTYRAAARIALEDYAGAVQDAGRALELAPASYLAWIYLGYGLENQGRSGEAIDAYKRAMALPSTPDNTRSKLAPRLAELEKKLGR